MYGLVPVICQERVGHNISSGFFSYAEDIWGSFSLSNFIVRLFERDRPWNGMKKILEKGPGVFGINCERVQLIEVFFPIQY